MAQNPSSGFSQSSWIAQQNRLGQVPPSNTGEGAYTPYDPMQNLAQQAVQNPNAGDKYQQAAVADEATNPDGTKKEKPGWGPKIPGVSTMAGDADAGEIGAATVLGIGTGGLAYYLTKKNSKTGVDRHIEHAENLDKVWGIKQVSKGMNSIPAPGFLKDKDWYKYWSLSYPTELNGQALEGAELEAHIIKHQQGVHIERSLKNFNKAIEPDKRSLWTLGIGKTKDLKTTYNGLHETLGSPENRQKVIDMHQQSVYEKLGVDTKFNTPDDAKKYYEKLEKDKNIEALQALKDGNPLSEQKVGDKKPTGFKYPINNAEDFAIATHFDPQKDLKDLSKGGILKDEPYALERIVQTQELKRAHLEKRVKQPDATKEEKALLKKLNGSHDFLDKGVLQSSGVAGGNIREKALLTRQMREKNVGSVGKFYVTTMNHMKNIFGGEMMMGSMGKGKMAAIPMLIFGSLVSSAMVIAPAIHAGNQADKGDKTKSFLENFVGFGICNFIGWELGRRFLAGTGLMHKILGRHALKHPLKFIPNHGFLGKWARRTTLGGFTTELVAMFAAGAIAESMGKKVVDLFFPGNGNKKKQDKNGEVPPPTYSSEDSFPPPAYSSKDPYPLPGYSNLNNSTPRSSQDTVSFGAVNSSGTPGQPYFGASPNTGTAQASASGGNAGIGNSGPQDSQYQDILNSSMVKNADNIIQQPNPYKQQPYGLSGAS